MNSKRALVVASGLALLASGVGVALWQSQEGADAANVESSEDQRENPDHYPLDYRVSFRVTRSSGSTARIELMDQAVAFQVGARPACEDAQTPACKREAGQPLDHEGPVLEGACDPGIPADAYPSSLVVSYPGGAQSGVTAFHYCAPQESGASVGTTWTFHSGFAGWGRYVVTVTWMEGWVASWWGGKYGTYRTTAQTVDYVFELESPGWDWLA